MKFKETKTRSTQKSISWRIIAFLNSSNFSGSSDIDCANLNIDDKSSSMTARLRSFNSLMFSYNNSNLSNNSCVSR